ncbi:hypothetical protein D3C86_1957310 [compost metagenome]
MGYGYSQVDILKLVDPIAFREAYNNWVDSLDNNECEAYREMVEELDFLGALIEEQESEEE